MKLPNGDHLRVDRKKITEYLLSPTHPDGHSKAEFFTRFGFCLEHWQLLAEVLRGHGTTNPVVSAVETPYGTRYIIEGRLASPDSRNPLIRTVWIVEKGKTSPRLITAYPLEDGYDQGA